MNIKTNRVAIGKVGVMALVMAVAAVWAAVAIAGMNEDLFEASMRGDLPEVKRLLAKGADVNAKITMGPILELNLPKIGGLTALKAACFGGHREVVEVLLAKGADVNAMSKTNRTALGEALMMGPYPEIREMLIKAGADPRTEKAWMKYHLPPPEPLPQKLPERR